MADNQPFNYMLNVPDPAESARKNLEFATGLVGAQQKTQAFGLQQQAAQVELSQQQQQMQQQAALRAQLAAMGPNPTHEQIRGLLWSNPQIGATLKPAIDQQDADEKSAMISQMSKPYAAMINNKPDVAISELEKTAIAFDNNGMPDKAAHARSFISLIKSGNMPIAAVALAAPLSQAMGPNFANFGTTAKLPDELRTGAATATTAELGAKKEAALAPFVAPQARATLDATKQGTASASAATDLAQKTFEQNKAKLAQDKLKSDAEIAEINQRMNTLPPEIAKTVAGYRDTARQKQNLADKQTALADYIKLNADKLDSGIAGQAGAFLRKQFGTENAYDDLKNQFDAFKSAELLRDLKEGGGRQSPAGIELEKTQFPDRNASPALLETAVRRMAAGNEYDARIGRFNAGYVSNNRGEGPATKDFSFGDFKFTKGQDPDEALKSIRPKTVAFAGAAPQSGAPTPSAAPTSTIHPPAVRLAQLNAREAELLKKRGRP